MIGLPRAAFGSLMCVMVLLTYSQLPLFTNLDLASSQSSLGPRYDKVKLHVLRLRRDFRELKHARF